METLGVVDLGIYNVVAGIVAMLGVMSSSLSGATSRFLTYEIGNGGENLETIFRCSATVHYILVAIIIFLGETIGLWFVIEKLVIPSSRLTAAIWIYQCAILAVAIRIVSTPYNAIIVAYERMSAFAYLSLIEAFLQLGLVFLLKYIDGDRLIFYGIFLALTQILVRLSYHVYCVKFIKGANGKWLWESNVSKRILKFAGWTMVGYGAVVGYTQGINVLLNLFYGPIANAARGFSNQIQTGVNQLSSNFQMALRPPIIKAHSQADYEYMHKLMIVHAKYSFFLVLIMIVPIVISTPYLLELWLVNVPEYTVDFTRLTLIGTLYCTLNGHTIVAIHAKGDLKKFQLAEGGMLLLTLPIAYFLLKYHNMSANGVIIVYLVIEFITQFVRVGIVYPKIFLNPSIYIKKICVPVVRTIIPITIYTLYG
ncbi:MAG: lipopolysaccharide biosynthesis protein, partial [Muribaculaceae bacterium]|nr:lipopolysaccharide biosynthesis protein [Muribaculaceae bacterium]